MRIKLDPVRDFSPETLDEISSIERDRFAKALINIHSKSDESIVIGIDGEWGTGKTVFLRRLVQMAKKEGFRAHYFDAFENDISQDAFVSLASSISIFLEQEFGPEASKKFISAAARVGKTFLIGLGSKVIEHATGGILDGAAQTALKDSAVGPQSDLERLIHEATNRPAALGELRTAIQRAQKNDDAEGQKILFVIDELDRCRPDFSIELLECIKHIFSINGVNFIIGANFTQLSNIIERKYGLNETNSRYFEKFLDLRHTLSGSFGQGVLGHEKVLSDIRKGFDGPKHPLKHRIFDELAFVFSKKGYSIRTFIKTLETANLAYTQARNHDPESISIIAVVSAFKVLNPKGYILWLSGNGATEDSLLLFHVSDPYADVERLRTNINRIFDRTDHQQDSYVKRLVINQIEPGLFGDDR